MSSLDAAANVCGLRNVLPRTGKHHSGRKPHRESQKPTQERGQHMRHDLHSRITFHMLSGLQKNQTAILKLAICLSAFCYLFQERVGRKGNIL